jgi:DnaJ-class molecular chaperone
MKDANLLQKGDFAKHHYNKLALKYHPDKSGEDELFKQLVAAYQCLNL